jgi:integrase/recombinase XerC
MLGPETLTGEECDLLLAHLSSAQAVGRGARQRLRNWGLVMIMLEAGLRVAELAGLRLGDVVFRGAPVRMLIVRGEIAKRGVERQIPVSVRLSGALGKLIRELWCERLEEAGTLCWTVGTRGGHLTTRQIEYIVRAAGLAALGRPVHPHVLRHTFGTRIERVGGIRVAQELLGHADIRTTQMYCHPNGDDLRQAVNGEPRERRD